MKQQKKIVLDVVSGNHDPSVIIENEKIEVLPVRF